MYKCDVVIAITWRWVYFTYIETDNKESRRCLHPLLPSPALLHLAGRVGIVRIIQKELVMMRLQHEHIVSGQLAEDIGVQVALPWRLWIILQLEQKWGRSERQLVPGEALPMMRDWWGGRSFHFFSPILDAKEEGRGLGGRRKGKGGDYVRREYVCGNMFVGLCVCVCNMLSINNMGQ